MAATAKSFLTDFPFKIREQIYQYVFESPSGRISFEFQRHRENGRPANKAFTTEANPHILSLSLFNTKNRQIYSECRDLLWEYNKVTVGSLYCQTNSTNDVKYVRFIDGLRFQTDEQTTKNVRGVSMIADFMHDSSRLSQYYIVSPSNLEMVFRT